MTLHCRVPAGALQNNLQVKMNAEFEERISADFLQNRFDRVILMFTVWFDTGLSSASDLS